ncbi:hypothetical protein [Nocardia sp. BMG111209]|nr:hypothetical protein [Nocardia sp. BMG111209]
MLILAIATVIVPAAAVLAWATIAATYWCEARHHHRLPHDEHEGDAPYRV